MSNVIRTFRKAAIEKRRLFVDYSCWLDEAEELTGFQTVTSPLTSTPLTISVAYVDATNRKLSLQVGGGLGNTNYVVQLVVTTDIGQVKRDDIGIRVNP